MKPERWAQIQDAFHAAIESEAHDLPAYLARMYPDDPELRHEVESLLRAHEDSSHFLEQGAIENSGSGIGNEVENKVGATLLIGDRVHQYEILSLLGAGGMGEVYLAVDTRLHRQVALKVLPRNPNFLLDRLRRFEQEARTASALSHPNVCVIYEINQTDKGDHYIAMEHVQGSTLRKHLSARSIPVGEALRITIQVASALSAAHKAGIIHRDIKPENIMVSAEGQVKLLDFGIAKLLLPQQETATQLSLLCTQPGTVVGTVKYMSPEQARGIEVDSRTDLWSLGVVFREMLTGSTPFEGPTPTDVLVGILGKQPSSLPRTLPNFTVLESVDRRLLSKDPQARYQSANELIQDLEGVNEDSRAPSLWRNALRLSFRRRGIVLASLLMFLVAIAGFLYYRGRRDLVTASSEASAESDHRRVVAVLSFENISHDPSQEYFSAGITEEINGQLAKLGSIQLVSRAAIARYKSSPANLQQIASELGVGSIVTGSVRQNAGGRVRVNVELVDAHNQRTIWAEQYDRELKDIFAVQSDIAVRIANALGAALSPSEREHIEKRPTENMAAYELYLQARALPMNIREDNFRAIEMLQKAFTMDSRFALALAHIAYRQGFQGYFGDSNYLDLGVESARQALSIDPNLAEAHFSLGSAYSIKGELTKARLSFLKALELKPNFIEAMNNLSLEEIDAGRLDEALYWGARSFHLAPNSGNSYYHLSVALIFLGDDATAQRWLTEGEEHHPTATRVQIMRAILDFVHLGKTDQGLRRVRKALNDSPDDEELGSLLADLTFIAKTSDAEERLHHVAGTEPENYGFVLPETNRLKYAYQLLRRGQTQTAMRLVEQSETRARRVMQDGNEAYYPRIELAASYSLRGNTQQALEWLELAYVSGARDHNALEIDPLFEKLRTDSHFKEIAQRMARDVAQRRDRARGQLPEIFSSPQAKQPYPVR